MMSNNHFQNELLIEKIKHLEEEVSALRKQQNDITMARDYYLKIFEDFPALIWRARLDKKCDYFNRTWLNFTGRTMEQEFGDGWTEGVHKDDLEFCVNKYVASFDKREPFEMQYRLRNRDGEYRWINDIGRPFYGLNDEFMGYIGSCYDITENRNNFKKIKEINESKDIFFSIMAHDLRNPINSFANAVTMLKDILHTGNIDEIEKLLDLLKASAINTQSLLENLLLWSSSQTGRIVFSPDNIDLKKLIENSVSLVQNRANEKNISIEIISGKPANIFADTNMIETIIRNLITNAVKFSHKGGRIKIYFSESAEGHEVSISDNGIGIEKSEIDKIFDITKKKRLGTSGEPGTGLGLILCKEFVDYHCGKISVKSDPGSGSTFTVSIPREFKCDKSLASRAKN